MYHSACTPRERDRLRQIVLEDMGWKIYRVWSTDWIKDRHTEGERLLAAIEKAINNYHEISPASRNITNDKVADFLDITTVSVNENIREGVQQKFTAIRSPYYGRNVKDVAIKDIAVTMAKVVMANFGFDKIGIFKETALYGYGWERQGSSIKTKFEKVYSLLLEQNFFEEGLDGKIKFINKSDNNKITCSKCGETNEKGDTFCGKCGNKIN